MRNNYLEKIDQDRRNERKETIERMYMACYTAQEIAEVVGLTRKEIDNLVKSDVMVKMETSSKITISANFTDDSFRR